jgi:hypothetical protein
MNKHLRSIHQIPADMANLRTRPKSHTGPLDSPQSMHPGYSYHSPPGGSHQPETYTRYTPSPYPSESPTYEYRQPSLSPVALTMAPRDAREGSRSTAAPRSKIPGPHARLPIPDPHHLYEPIPLPLQPVIHNHSYQSPHVRNPSPDAVTYMQYGSDADLMNDPDLYHVIPRIRARVYQPSTPVEDIALAAVRARYPRSVKPDTTDPDSDDSFDEGVLRGRIDESRTEIGRISESAVKEERSVYGHSFWAAKLIMSKAKLMLVEEETRMRREPELASLLEDEAELVRTLEELKARERAE